MSVAVLFLVPARKHLRVPSHVLFLRVSKWRYGVWEGITSRKALDDRRSPIKETSAQQILVPLIFVLNFGDAAPGFQSRHLQEENVPL